MPRVPNFAWLADQQIIQGRQPLVKTLSPSKDALIDVYGVGDEVHIGPASSMIFIPAIARLRMN